MGLFRRRNAAEAAVDVRAGEAPPNTAAVGAGVPGRCPACDGFGYIDRIDLVNRNQTQHCVDCGKVWSFDFDEDGAVIDLAGPTTERSPSAYWIDS